MVHSQPFSVFKDTGTILSIDKGAGVQKWLHLILFAFVKLEPFIQLYYISIIVPYDQN